MHLKCQHDSKMERFHLEVKVKLLSRVRPSATPWTAAFQAPPSMGFARQEYWSGVPLPSPISLLGLHNKVAQTE